MIFQRKVNMRACLPGDYAPVESSEHHAVLICPVCKKAILISKAIHQILPNGAVTPSFVCTHTNCTFHVMIELADWNQCLAL